MALRSAFVSDLARALAPARPLRTLPDLGLGCSSSSPVAILATMTAAPINSATYLPMSPTIPRQGLFDYGPKIQTETLPGWGGILEINGRVPMSGGEPPEFFYIFELAEIRK